MTDPSSPDPSTLFAVEPVAHEQLDPVKSRVRRELPEPEPLERHGPGFEAAAMVRLMHSMVRYNALKRSGQWDSSVYGMPIPQVDQMPAGLIAIYLTARKAKRDGRTEFTAQERAVVEFARYRCFLLGLPEELLPDTPDDVLHLMHARAALLRDGFDDATCGALVRATMAASLRAGDTRFDHAAEAVEKSYSKAFFIQGFNLRIPVMGDGAILKSTGFWFLEPSVLSQTIAFAIVIEYMYFRRPAAFALFGAAYLTSFSGTGFILLVGVAVALAVQQRQILPLVIVVIAGVCVPVLLQDVFPFSVLVERHYPMPSIAP